MNGFRETKLMGGRTAIEVVRIEDTVRRPIGAHSEFTHLLLSLLEEKDFSGAPRFLGVDDKGREILTFIEGDVPHREINWTDDQLTKVVRMLRELHDATVGSDLAGEKEVVCHNDIAPWNVVLKEDEPIAFIDFDGAAPGRRVDDLAYFLWTFLGLGGDTPVDIQAARMKKLSAMYAFTDGHKLVDAILEQQKGILTMREELAKNAPDSVDREFSASKATQIRSEMEWVKANREGLESILFRGHQSVQF